MSPRKRRWPRVFAGVLSAGVLVVTGVAGAGAVAYRNLDDNITAAPVTRASDTPRSKQTAFEEGEPVNILVMGSDTREGQADDTRYGSTDAIAGARSDTTLLVHIAADRKSVLAVSIPRDTLVDIPACTKSDGTVVAAKHKARFNEAFFAGGPSCSIATVEQVTGVDINHYVVVDFNGFKGVVDAIDGVDVCLKKAVNDPLSGLKLPAGTSTVKGEDALAFVRARYTLGDGSDISRIERQQAFIASAVRKATSSQVLANPMTAYRMLDEVTKSLTTDEALSSLSNVQSLALSMSDLTPSAVTFITAPITYNTDGATVSIDKAAADPIWSAIRNDTGWPPPPTIPPGSTEPLHVAPADISLTVLNGTSTDGRSAAVAATMTQAGYKVVATGSYPTSDVVTPQVFYAPGQEQAARTVAYAVGAGGMTLDPNLSGRSVVLVAGSAPIAPRTVVVAPLPTDPGTAAPSPSTSNTSGSHADAVTCV